MNTDIVIGVRNCHTVLPACLESIEKHTQNYRLIFNVDDATQENHDVVDAFCRRHTSSIKITTFKQRWFTRSYNLGLRMVRTPWAVALNSDTVVDANWLTELYECVEDARKVTGKEIGLVGSVYSAEEPRRWVETINPGYVTGHCWLLNMASIEHAANHRGTPGWYLDEIHPHNIHIRSDIEICWVLNGLGYATIQCHKSAVGHIFGHSWGLNLAAIPGTVAQVNDEWTP